MLIQARVSDKLAISSHHMPEKKKAEKAEKSEKIDDKRSKGSGIKKNMAATVSSRQSTLRTVLLGYEMSVDVFQSNTSSYFPHLCNANSNTIIYLRPIVISLKAAKVLFDNLPQFVPTPRLHLGHFTPPKLSLAPSLFILSIIHSLIHSLYSICLLVWFSLFNFLSLRFPEAFIHSSNFLKSLKNKCIYLSL